MTTGGMVVIAVVIILVLGILGGAYRNSKKTGEFEKKEDTPAE